MTPAARKEIAIGMKISVLSAVPNLMRSVRTANTSPMAAASISRADPDEVVLDRGPHRIAVEHLAVVVDAGEVAALSKKLRQSVKSVG